MSDLLSPPVIVLGLSPTGLYAARELGRAGIPVGGATDEPACGTWSRFLKFRPRVIRHRDDEELLAGLNRAADSTQKRIVLMPTSDRYIDFIARHHDALSERFTFQPNYAPELAPDWLDKSRFYAMCRRHRIPHPQLQQYSAEELRDQIQHLAYPCMLKPAVIHEVRQFMAGRKVLLFSEAIALQEAATTLPPASNWLVQEIVGGPESNIWLHACACEHGEVRQMFTARKLRQYPPGFGSASLVLSQRHPELEQHTAEFLRATGFHGMCGVEYKLAPDGTYKMIEINPRPTLWFHVSNAAGTRIALTTYRILTGTEETATTQQIDDVRWRYGLKDGVSQLAWRFDRAPSVLPPPEIPSLSRGPRTSAVFQWSDPAPEFGELLNYARKLTLRVIPSRRKADKLQSS